MRAAPTLDRAPSAKRQAVRAHSQRRTGLPRTKGAQRAARRIRARRPRPWLQSGSKLVSQSRLCTQLPPPTDDRRLTMTRSHLLWFLQALTALTLSCAGASRAAAQHSGTGGGHPAREPRAHGHRRARRGHGRVWPSPLAVCDWSRCTRRTIACSRSRVRQSHRTFPTWTCWPTRPAPPSSMSPSGAAPQLSAACKRCCSGPSARSRA